MRRTRTGEKYRTRYQETNALARSLQLLAGSPTPKTSAISKQYNVTKPFRIQPRLRKLTQNYTRFSELVCLAYGKEVLHCEFQACCSSESII
jgi:hypothetical protein